jgi:short subunit dehydrogenase-like uncharacterized protein
VRLADVPNNAIWILGATGRIGRAVARRLAAQGLAPVLVGRDAEALATLVASLGGNASVRVSGALSDTARMMGQERPRVVVNTIGPFTHTALLIAQACRPGTHYVDLSNELPSVLELLAQDGRARQAGSIVVTGAGFGVLATECVVLTLCRDRPAAARVRCSAIPAVENEPGRIGEAFAASITGAFAYGGRQYEAGELTDARLLGDYSLVLLPDGRRIGTATGPTGELEAARRSSGAPSVVSATSMVPSSAMLRATLPALSALMRIGAVRRFATRRIASVVIKPTRKEAPPVSWSHARVDWPSGESREGWMRTGDAMVFTADVVTEVVARLARGEGSPGAYTPGALFGPELATSCLGEIIVGMVDEGQDPLIAARR